MGAVRDELARKVFLEMARARLAEAEKRPDARYKRVVAVLGSLATCRNTFMLTALPKEHDMREALAGVLTDIENKFSDATVSAARSSRPHVPRWRGARKPRSKSTGSPQNPDLRRMWSISRAMCPT